MSCKLILGVIWWRINEEYVRFRAERNDSSLTETNKNWTKKKKPLLAIAYALSGPGAKKLITAARAMATNVAINTGEAPMPNWDQAERSTELPCF